MTAFQAPMELAALACAFSMTPTLMAATVTWDGGGDGQIWHNPLNWDTDTVPLDGDDVVIPAIAAHPILFYLGTTSINSLACEEDLTILEGTLNLNGPSVMNGILTLRSTLGGSGDLTVNGTLDWIHGSNSRMDGTGRTIISSTGKLNRTGGALARALDNYGVATWLESDWSFAVGAVFTNYNVFHVPFSGPFRSMSGPQDACAFHNFGEFVKTGTGTVGLGDSSPAGNMPFNNSGTVRVVSGQMGFESGTHSGQFLIAGSGSTLVFGNGSHTLSSSCVIAGDGELQLSAAQNTSFVCDGIIQVTGPIRLFGGNIHINGQTNVGSILEFLDGDSPSNVVFNGDVSFGDSGLISAINPELQLTFNGPNQVNLAGYLQSGEVHFNSPPVVTRTLDWLATKFVTSHPLHVARGATLNLTLGNPRINIELINHGTVNHSSGDLRLEGPGEVRNYGVWNAGAPSGFLNVVERLPGATGGVTNDGVMSCDGPGEIRFSDVNGGVPLINRGTIHVNIPYFELRGGGVNLGQIIVGTGSVFHAYASYNYYAGSEITGAGDMHFGEELNPSSHDVVGLLSITGHLVVEGGTVWLHNAVSPSEGVSIHDTGVLHTAVDQSWTSLNLVSCCGNAYGGTLDGPGNVTVTDTCIVRGTMSGTGQTVIAKGATITTLSDHGGAQPTFERLVENHGTFEWSNYPFLRFREGTLVNHGSIVITPQLFADSVATGESGLSTIINHGSITKLGQRVASFEDGGGSLEIENHGSIHVLQGEMQINCGGQGDGSLQIESDASLRLGSPYQDGSLELHGSLHASSTGRLALGGTFLQSPTGLTSLTVDPLAPMPPIAVSNLEIDGGLQAVFTPLPQHLETLTLMTCTSPPVVGQFAQHAFQPVGDVSYESQAVIYTRFAPGDVNGDNIVNIDDLLDVIAAWGNCPALPGECPDLDGNGVINIDDLLMVIGNWPTS